jgi:hypothetical protein
VEAFLPPLKAYGTGKVVGGAIVQGAPLVFSKDGSVFMFDHEASTVTFCNIPFV